GQVRIRERRRGQRRQAAHGERGRAGGRRGADRLEIGRGARRGIYGEGQRRVRGTLSTCGFVENDTTVHPGAGQGRIADVDGDGERLRGARSERELARRHRDLRVRRAARRHLPGAAARHVGDGAREAALADAVFRLDAGAIELARIAAVRGVLRADVARAERQIQTGYRRRRGLRAAGAGVERRRRRDRVFFAHAAGERGSEQGRLDL